LEKGWERKELAKKLRVHKNTVCEWENDRKRPSGKGMERLIRFFKVTRGIMDDFK
jgi:ribosome-binding protein aMBF1 (putative translation factor)